MNSGTSRLAIAALISILAILATQAAPPPQPDPLTRIVQTLGPQVVIVEVSGRERRPDSLRRELLLDPEAQRPGAIYLAGAGVLISADGIVLSHSSLFPFVDGNVLVSIAGRRYPARILARAEEQEAVLLKIQGELPELPAARIASAAPLPGTAVLSFGNPLSVSRGRRCSVTLGVLGAISQTPIPETSAAGPRYILDSAVNPGAYGGPIFDLEGRLLGIASPLSRSPRSGALLRLARPAPAMIEALHKKLAEARPGLGLVLGRSPEAAQGGWPIEAVRPASPAGRAGIKAGDRLLKVAGEPLRSLEQLEAILRDRPMGAPLRLELLRPIDAETLQRLDFDLVLEEGE